MNLDDLGKTVMRKLVQALYKHSWLGGVMVITFGKWSEYPGMKLHFRQLLLCLVHQIRWRIFGKKA